jgi:hypothetical protein
LRNTTSTQDETGGSSRAPFLARISRYDDSLRHFGTVETPPMPGAPLQQNSTGHFQTAKPTIVASGLTALMR